MKGMRIVLVGLGHEMHGDDEVGLEVVREWSEQGQKEPSGMDIQTLLLDSPGVNLLGSIAGLNAAILVAAVRSGARLGSIQILKDEELTALEGSGGVRGGWGAAETLSLGRQLAPEELPEKLILIGIEGAAFGLGEGLSPAVRAAIPQALRALDRSLDEIRRSDRTLAKQVKRLIKQLGGIFTRPKPAR